MEYNDLIGIPFKYGGRTLSGIDCWGLVIEFYRRLGITVEDPVAYGEEVQNHDDLFGRLREADEKRKEEWLEIEFPSKLGDLCFFSRASSNIPIHVGIWLPKNRILHTAKRTGSIITPTRRLKTKLKRVWRNKWLR